MDPDLAHQIDQFIAIIYTLAALVTVLCAYIVTLPIAGDTKPPRKGKVITEFCKLHARPVHECRSQHEAD